MKITTLDYRKANLIALKGKLPKLVVIEVPNEAEPFETFTLAELSKLTTEK